MDLLLPIDIKLQVGSHCNVMWHHLCKSLPSLREDRCKDEEGLPFSKPPPSQVQASKLGQPTKPATLFEVPEWVTRLVAFDRRYSKWVHESLLTDRTFTFLRFFEFSGDGLFWLPGTTAFWLSPSLGECGHAHVCIEPLHKLAVGSVCGGMHQICSATEATQIQQGTLSGGIHENSYYMSQYDLPCVEHRLLSIAQHVLNVWLAAATASRVILGRHYILDVLGGLVIGVLEASVAHLCLHVPLHVSDMQHAYFVSRFRMYEDLFWRFFHGRWLFTNYHRDMDAEVHDNDHQPLRL